MRKVIIATALRIPHVGGASTHIANLTRGLEEDEWDVQLVSLGRDWEHFRPDLLVKRFVRRDASRAQTLERTIKRLQNAISRCLGSARDVIVHAHDPVASVAAQRCGLGRRLRVIQTVHGPWSREVRTHLGASAPGLLAAIAGIEREALTGAHQVIAVDSGQHDIVVQEFGVPRDRVSVVPNAVDVNSLLTEAGTDGERTSAILVPRRLVPKNGVGVAIGARARLGAKYPRLVIAGDGPLRTELERTASALGTAGSVTFLGDVAHHQLMSLTRGAGVVLIPSVPAEGVVEATSLALLEAMALETPVIASNIGGLAEILSGGDGLLVPAGDEKCLAEAIRAVLSWSDSERAAKTRAAKEHVSRNYGLRTWIDRTQAIYAKALDQG